MNLAFFLLVAVGAYMTSIAGVGRRQMTASPLHRWVRMGVPWDSSSVWRARWCSPLCWEELRCTVFANDYLALTLVAIGQGFLFWPPMTSAFNGTPG